MGSSESNPLERNADLCQLVSRGILADKFCITASIFNPEAGDPYMPDDVTEALLLACPLQYQGHNILFNGFGTRGIWNLLLQQPMQRRRQVADSLVPELRKAVPKGMRNLITADYFLQADLIDMVFKLNRSPVYNGPHSETTCQCSYHRDGKMPSLYDGALTHFTYMSMLERRDELRNTGKKHKKKRRVCSTNDLYAIQKTESVSPYNEALSKLQHCMLLLGTMTELQGLNDTYYVQDEIIRTILGAILHYIVGEEAAGMYRTDFLNYIGVHHVTRKMMFILPRQSGKTTAMAMVLCLFLLCCPGKFAVCYATSVQQAKEMKDRAKQIFNQMPCLAGYKVLVDNKQNFHVRHPDGTVTKIQCCSPVIDSNRGVSPDIIFFDEFEFGDVAFYEAVAAPLINKRGRAFFTTSTPGKTTSPMVELRKKWAQMPPNPEYGVMSYALMCNSCRRANIGSICHHRMWIMPAWRSTYIIQDVRNMFTDGSENRYLTEVYGETISDDTAMLNEDDIEFCFDKKHDLMGGVGTIDPKVPMIFIAVDPSGGGASNMGMVAFLRTTDRYQVVRISVSHSV